MGTTSWENRQDPEGGGWLGEQVGEPTCVVTREQKFQGPENGGGEGPRLTATPNAHLLFDLARVPRWFTRVPLARAGPFRHVLPPLCVQRCN